MTDEEFQIVKTRVNEILTEDTSRLRETMNGTVSQLYKGGGTNRPSDQLPVFLLNSVYQLLNHVINERLKKILEPANILEPGQGGGRQGSCVGINMQKVHFIQQQAKRVYRVDIDFKTAFNAMSQAALWQVMRMFKIPDVDILEQNMKAPLLGWLQTMRKVQQSPSMGCRSARIRKETTSEMKTVINSTT